MSTAVGVGVASIIVSIASSLTAAGGQMAAAKEQKKIGRMQQDAAEEQEAAAREAARLKEHRAREEGRRIMGAIAARIGASGVEYSGSPLLAMKETERQLEEDYDIIRQGGELESSGWARQARIFAASTNSAYRYGMLSSTLTGLQGVSQGLGTWGSMNR